MVEYEQTAPHGGEVVDGYRVNYSWTGGTAPVQVVKPLAYNVQKIKSTAFTAPISGSFTLSFGTYKGDFVNPICDACVTVNTGASALVTNSDFRSHIPRGDFFTVNNHEFRVCMSGTYSAVAVPLCTVADATVTTTYNGSAVAQSAAYMLDTSLGTVTINQDEALMTFGYTSGAANDVSAKINRGDLIRVGDPDTGLTFRVHSLPGAQVDSSGLTLATVEDASVTASYPTASLVNGPAYVIQTSVPLPFNAQAGDVKAALEALPQVSTVDVNRSTLGNGYEWAVTFSQDRSNLRELIPNFRLLAAPSNDAKILIHSVGQHLITGLAAGVQVSVTVEAHNSRGYGTPTAATPPSISAMDRESSPPTRLSVMGRSPTELYVSWDDPEFTGGLDVTSYDVEWDTSITFDSASGSPMGHQSVNASPPSSVFDVQAMTTSASADDLGGFFRVTFNGQTTPELPHNVQAADMQTALNNLSTITGCTVTRNIVNHGHTWLVTFNNMEYEGSEYGQLQVHKRGLRGTNADVIVKGYVAVQHLRCYKSTGNFKLQFMGQETVDISHNANADTLRNAILALPNVHEVSVVYETRGETAHTFACQGNARALITLGWSLSATPYEREHIAHMATLSCVGTGCEDEVWIDQDDNNRNMAQLEGVLPHATTITGLTGGTSYYVRVAAYNSLGYSKFNLYDSNMSGECQDETCVLGIPMPTFARAPTAPTSVVASIAGSTELNLTFSEPVSTGGAAIDNFKVEWDTVDSFDSMCGDRYETWTIQMERLDRAAIPKLCVRADGPIAANQANFAIPWGVQASTLEDTIETAFSLADDAVQVIRYGVTAEQTAGYGAVGFGFVYKIMLTGAHEGNLQDLILDPDQATCNGGNAALAAKLVASLKVEDGLGAIQGDPGACSGVHAKPIGYDEPLLATLSAAASTPGSYPFVYTIKNLIPGTQYFVRISASNDNGRNYGPVMVANNGASIAPSAVANVPRPLATYSALSLDSPTSLKVDYRHPYNLKPEGNNGAPVTSYKIYYGKQAEEVQLISVTASQGIAGVTAGQFKLTYNNGSTTENSACLDYNMSAADLQWNLNKLDKLEGVVVTKSSDENGHYFSVTFSDSNSQLDAEGNVIQLAVVAEDDNCTNFAVGSGTAGAVVTTTTEGVSPQKESIVTITTNHSSAISGNFKLGVGYVGDMTQALPGAATVLPGSNVAQFTGSGESDMRILINRGDRIKIGNEIFRVHATDPFFSDSVPLDSYHRAGCKACTTYIEDTNMGMCEAANGSATCTTTNNMVLGDRSGNGDGLRASNVVSETETIMVRRKDGNMQYFSVAAAASGSISFDSNYVSPRAVDNVTVYRRKTVSMNFDESADSLKLKLESLPEVGSVDVQRTGPTIHNGYVWSITFTSQGSASACQYNADGTILDMAAPPCLHAIFTANSSKGWGLLPTGATASTKILQSGVLPLTPTWSEITAGPIKEVQRIKVTAAGKSCADGSNTDAAGLDIIPINNDDGTNFDLDFKGPEWPVGHADWNDSSRVEVGMYSTVEDLKWLLETIPRIGHVTVTRSAGADGFEWLVTFDSNLGDLPLLTSSDYKADWTKHASWDLAAGAQCKVGADADQSRQYLGAGTGGMMSLATCLSACTNQHTVYAGSAFQAGEQCNGFVEVGTGGAECDSNGCECWFVTGGCTSTGTNANFNIYQEAKNYFVEIEEVTQGVAVPLSHKIENLTTGNTYYTAVAANNLAGEGPKTNTEQNQGLGVIPLQQVAMTAPAAPAITSAKAVSNSQIEVYWAAPADNGSPIDKYAVEWWSTTPTAEVQTVQLRNTPGDTLGHFVLKYRASAAEQYSATVSIAHDASAADVAKALNNLPNLGQVNVTRSDVADNGIDWAITFSENIGDRQPVLCDADQLSGTSLTCAVDQTTAGSHAASEYGRYEMSANEFQLAVDPIQKVDVAAGLCGGSLDSVEQGTCALGNRAEQTIVVEATEVPTGTFTIWWRGMETAAIQANATAAQLKAAIEAKHPGVIVDVWRSFPLSVTDATRHDFGYGYEWRVVFSNVDGPVDTMVVDGEQLVGHDVTVGVYQRAEITITAQTLTSAITGPFVIELNGESTALLQFDATASEVEAALLNMDCIGSVKVSKVAPRSILPGTVRIPANSAVVTSSHDLADYVANGDTVYVVQPQGTDRKFKIKNATLTAHGFTLADSTNSANAPPACPTGAQAGVDELCLMSTDFEGQIARESAGSQFSIIFEVTSADLRTLKAYPANRNAQGISSTFRGNGIELHTRRPMGIAPLSYVIGAPVEVQTVTLWNPKGATALVNANSGGFRLRDNTGSGHQTPCMGWAVAATTMRDNIEAQFSGFDQVSVERNGDASAAYNYGYTYTISFWGEHSEAALNSRVPGLDIDLSGCDAFAPGAAEAVIRSDTLVNSAAWAAYEDRYVSLEPGATYTVRVTAKNAAGFGEGSTYVQVVVPSVGVVPSAPTSLILGERYTATSQSLSFDPPVFNGGQDITKYKIEWDSSPTFSSSNYKSDSIRLRDEVQHVVASFDSTTGRGGTFTLSWGGKTTGPLLWNIAANVMAAELRTITTFNAVHYNPIHVTRSTFGNGYKWVVTFRQPHGNVKDLISNDTMLEGINPRVDVTEVVKGEADLTPGDFTYEQQSIVTSADSAISSGTFDVAMEGFSTTVQWNESAAALKTKLETLPTIHTVNVEVEAKTDAAGTATGENIWTIGFTHMTHERVQGAGNVQLMVASNYSSLNGANAKVEVVETIQGTNPLLYNITGLTAGVKYYARVSAYNAVGFGPLTNVVDNYPRSQPDAPNAVSITVIDHTHLKANWEAPTHDGGSPITDYLVEYFSAPPTREVQTVTVSSLSGNVEVQEIETTATADNIDGFFKVTFEGATTEDIPHDASAAVLKAKLERLSTIGQISVSARDYSKFPLPGYVWIAQGSNTLNFASATDWNTVPARLRNSQQVPEIWIAGQKFCYKRDHELTFSNGAGTAKLVSCADGSSATNWTLASILEDNAVTAYQWGNGYAWQVTFLGGHVGDQPLLVPGPGTSWSGTEVAINCRALSHGLQAIAGNFRLQYNARNTVPLPYNASAAAVKAGLEALSSVGTVDVTRFDNGNGFSWRIEFTSELGDLPMIVANDDQLTGPSAKADVSETIPGVLPADYVAHTITDLSTHPTFSDNLTSLTAGTGYHIRVRAHNAEGYGPQATPESGIEAPRSLPGVPTNVALVVMGPSVLKAAWNPPADASVGNGWKSGGAFVDRYRVEWDVTANFSNIATSGFVYELANVGDGSGPFYYNIPITTQQAFYVRVSSHNSMGWGVTEVTTPTHATPAFMAPGAPASVSVTTLNQYQLRVQWTAPSHEEAVYGGNGGGDITGYLIEWDDDFDAGADPQSFDWPGSGQAVPADLDFTIGTHELMTGVTNTPLDPNVNYSVRVSAVNAEVGHGPPTMGTPAQSLTENKAPMKPLNPSAASDGSGTAIDINWNVPFNDGGGTIDEFHVEWSTSEDFAENPARGSVHPVPEEQVLILDAEVTQEVQHIEATVDVTNEVQRITTNVTGVDEVQTIQTTGDVVVPEVQTVTTAATDVSEVQVITTSANNVDEVQTVTTAVVHRDEVQVVRVTGEDIDEVQQIQIGNNGLIGPTGTFKLSFDTDEDCNLCRHKQQSGFTSDLSWSSTAADIKAALLALPNIGDSSGPTVGVTVSDPTTDNNSGAGPIVRTWLVTFNGNHVNGDVPMLQLHPLLNAAAGGLTTTVSQTVQGNELRGSFALSLDTSMLWPTSYPGSYDANVNTGGTTGPIRYNANAMSGEDLGGLTMQEKLQNAFNSNQTSAFGNIAVTRTYNDDEADANLHDGVGGWTWRITFLSLEGNVAPMTCITANNNLTNLNASADDIGGVGAGKPDVIITEAVQGSFAYGYFKIKVGSGAFTSANLQWNVSEADMKTAVESLANVGTVTVSRTQTRGAGENSWSGAYHWAITFNTDKGNVDPITIQGTWTTAATYFAGAAGGNPGNITTSVAETVQGNEVVGQFKVEFCNPTNTCATSAYIQQADSAAQVKAKLEAMSTITDVTVTQDSNTYLGPSKGKKWFVTFGHANEGGDVNPMSIPSTCGGGSATCMELTAQHGNANMIVTELVKGNQLSGAFRLTYGSEQTSALPYDASTNQVAAALAALDSIGPVSTLNVVRTVNDAQVKSYVWTITFLSNTHTSPCGLGINENWSSPNEPYSMCWGQNVGNIASLGCVATALSTTDGTHTCTIAETTPGTNPLGGFYKITFNTSGCATCAVKASHESGNISVRAPANISDGAGSMQEILQAMPNIGSVNVTRSAVVQNTGGYTYSITFLRDAYNPSCNDPDSDLTCLSPGDVPLFSVTGTNPGDADTGRAALLGTGANFNIAQATQGNVLRGKFKLVMGTQNLDTWVDSTSGANVNKVGVDWDTNSAQLKQALESKMTNEVGTVVVSRNRIDKYGAYVWQVTFVKNHCTGAGASNHDCRSGWHSPYGAGDMSNFVVSVPAGQQLTGGTVVADVVTPGSLGLSGEFFVAVTTGGAPSKVLFEEDAIHMQEKLQRLTTVGTVHAHRTQLGAGWSSAHTVGVRGGYRWTLTYVLNPGAQGEFTFPPGTRDVAPVTVTGPTVASASTATKPCPNALCGTNVSIDSYEITKGSAPVDGTIKLGYNGVQTGDLPLASFTETYVETALNGLSTIGAVSVSEDNHLTRAMPGTVDVLNGSDVAVFTFPGDAYEQQIENGYCTGHDAPPANLLTKTRPRSAWISGAAASATSTDALDFYAATRALCEAKCQRTPGCVAYSYRTEITAGNAISAGQNNCNPVLDHFTGVTLDATWKCYKKKIGGDVRSYLKYGGQLRIGGDNGSIKTGSNGDALATSASVTKGSTSIVPLSTSATLLTVGGTVRIDGEVYTIVHPGTEIQTVTVAATASITGGAFKLIYPTGTLTTSCIPYNASASVVKTALNGLFSNDPTKQIEVEREEHNNGVWYAAGDDANLLYTFSIYFTGHGWEDPAQFTTAQADSDCNAWTNEGGNVAVGTHTTTAATATASSWDGAKRVITLSSAFTGPSEASTTMYSTPTNYKVRDDPRKIVTITFSHSGAMSGGIKLTYDSQTTSDCIMYNSSAQEAEDVLRGGLTNLGADLVVTRSAQIGFGYVFTIFFPPGDNPASTPTSGGSVGCALSGTADIVETAAGWNASAELAIGQNYVKLGSMTNGSPYRAGATWMGPNSTSNVAYLVNGSRLEIEFSTNLGDVNPLTVTTTTAAIGNAYSIVDNFVTGDLPLTFKATGLLMGFPYFARVQAHNNAVSAYTGSGGTLDSGSVNGGVLPAGASGLNSFYVGKWIQFTGGTGANQGAYIATYVGSSRTFTVSPALSTTVAGDTTFALRTDYGDWSSTATSMVKAAPTAPEEVSVAPAYHTDEIQVITTGATHIDEVQVITSSAMHIEEVQKVTTTATVGSTVAGTFQLTIFGEQTAAMPHNVSAAAMKTAIENLGSTNGGNLAFDFTVNVIRSLVDLQGGYVWSITIITPASQSPNVAPITCSGNAAFGSSNATCGVGTIIDGNYIDGTFILAYDNAWTVSLDHDATATQVKNALETLVGITTVDVSRTGPDTEGGYVWQVTFTGNDGDVLPLAVHSSLVGTGVQIAVTAPTSGNELSGTFTLAYNGLATGAIPFDASAAVVKTALEALNGVGSLVVTRTAQADMEEGYSWTVTFPDPNMSGDLPLLVGNASGLSGVGANVLVREIRKGSEASGTGLAVSWSPPGLVNGAYHSASNDGGSAIDTYKVEVDTANTFGSANKTTHLINDAARIFEVQHVVTANTSGSTISGNFKLHYKTERTGWIPATATAHQVRMAIESMSTVTTVHVTKSYAKLELPGRWSVMQSASVATGSVAVNVGVDISPGDRLWFNDEEFCLNATQGAGSTTTLNLAQCSSQTTPKQVTNGTVTYDSNVASSGLMGYKSSGGFNWKVIVLEAALPLTGLKCELAGDNALSPAGSVVRIYGAACDKCFYIPALAMGSTHFVRVSAKNDMGYNVSAGPTVSSKPREVPGPPTQVTLASVASTQLEIKWFPPQSDGGDIVTSYNIEWDTDMSFGESYWGGDWEDIQGGATIKGWGNGENCQAQGYTESQGCSAAGWTCWGYANPNVPNAAGAGAPWCSNNAVNQSNKSGASFNYPENNCEVCGAGSAIGSANVSGAQIQATPPIAFVIGTGAAALNPALTYYVRITAQNSVPFQQVSPTRQPPMNERWESPTPTHLQPVDIVPGPPESFSVKRLGGTSLRALIQPPSRSGGQAVTKYKIEYDTVSTFTSASMTSIEVNTSAMTALYQDGPLLHNIESLTAGLTYFARVAAYNGVGEVNGVGGYGAFTYANPTSVVPAAGPSAPANVSTSSLQIYDVAPITDLTVTWEPPASSNGTAVDHYDVEWWSNDEVNEVQSIQISCTHPNETSGTFTVKWNGSNVGVPHDASADVMRFLLMTDLSTDHVEVSRAAIGNGFKWNITFVAKQGDQPPILADTTGLSAVNAGQGVAFSMTVLEVTSGQRPQGASEVQTIVMSHTSNITTAAGFWRLSFNGSGYTTYLSVTATNADVKRALEDLGTVNKVTVTSALNVGGKNTWNVTFDSNRGNVPKLGVDDTYLVTNTSILTNDGDNSVNPTTSAILCSDCRPGEYPAQWGHYTADALELSYVVAGLVSGQTYYSSVTAHNERGYGARGLPSPTYRQLPLQIPGPPQAVSLGVDPGSPNNLRISYSPPASNGGADVLKYKVEWCVLAEGVTAGTCFENPISSGVVMNQSSQSLLPGDIRCPNHNRKQVHVINVIDDNAGDANNPSGEFKLTMVRTGCNGAACNGAGDAVGAGTETTDYIDFDAPAMASDEVGDDIWCPDTFASCASNGGTEGVGSMQSHLEALSTITPGSVSVTRSAVGNGYSWTITFGDDGADFKLLVTDKNGAQPRLQNATVTTDTATVNGVANTPIPQVAGIVYGACSGYVTITGLTNGQQYMARVYAFNQKGFGLPGLAASSMKPMVVPGLPNAVALTIQSANQLRVSFDPPQSDGGDAITEYLVEADTASTFDSASTSQTFHGTTFTATHVGRVLSLSAGAPFIYTFHDLTMGQEYYIRVRAYNSQGYGLPQASSPVKEAPKREPSAPSLVRLLVTSDTKLTVAIEAPADNGGEAVERYNVKWDTQHGQGSTMAPPDKGTAVLAATANSRHTISSLSTLLTYYIEVQASNSMGPGNAADSTPLQISPALMVPGMPTSVTISSPSASTIQINWSAPIIPAHGFPCTGTAANPGPCPTGMGRGTEADGGSKILNYVVEYDQTPTFNSVHAAEETVAAVDQLGYPYQHSITGLVAGQAYYVRVRAVNSNGTGQSCGNAAVGSRCTGAALTVTAASAR
jgi:hypothetical protein